jgi:hypothetical protein
LNLAVAPEVPDNISVLVLSSPRAPLQKAEVAKIRRYPRARRQLDGG